MSFFPTLLPLRAVRVLAALLVVAAAAGNLRAQAPPAASGTLPAPASGSGLKTFEQQLGYSIGVNIGRDLKQEGLPLDPVALAAGINDVLSGGQVKLTDAQRQQVFAQLRQRLQAKQNEAALARMTPEQRQQAEQNRQTGVAFLTENAKKPGVQVTASGLQYKVIQPGTGATPTLRNAVRCNYEGRLINGKVFDASAKHGGPATFPVGGVISGWTEALQLMKVGAKWELYIPGDLAYGIRGSGPNIGPEETLIFTIELLDIVQR